ncbi:hypothetical protein J6590_105765, partial [Homalodisca vitripennis]
MALKAFLVKTTYLIPTHGQRPLHRTSENHAKKANVRYIGRLKTKLKRPTSVTSDVKKNYISQLVEMSTDVQLIIWRDSADLTH